MHEKIDEWTFSWQQWVNYEMVRLENYGISRRFILEDFWKFCRENLRFIKTLQEYRVLYMKTTYIYVNIYLIRLRIKNISAKMCTKKKGKLTLR